MYLYCMHICLSSWRNSLFFCVLKVPDCHQTYCFSFGVMNPLQNWMMCLSFWLFCCCCMPFLLFASPLPQKETDVRTNHSCVLRTVLPSYIKNCTLTIAEQARLSDKDTDNRFIGQHLYANIKEKDHCYVMKRVTDIIMKNVLSELKSAPGQYSNVKEVANFLAERNGELHGCKPSGKNEHIERNLKQMKDKLDKLGENGKNKAVGELDLLFEYLVKACTKAPAS
uniref:Interleukin 22 n=2 Tax=Anolis carolinensis TaxID=28377 RepID=H9G878_ANOCA|nr:PREDICTED: interleukin-22 isoform X1 [Anolis carolinensis]|eukprot:XP_016851347.1 PREDICTED: interleukin-22 isoform X1 [Anolis carolinensis]